MLNLKNKRVVITGSDSVGKDWEKDLKRQGNTVYRFPTIETAPVPLSSLSKLKYALAHLEEFGWIVFTSPAAPDYFKEFLMSVKINKSKITLPPIAVVGEKTAKAVRKAGYHVVFKPSIPNSAALARELKPFRSSILLLRSDIASPELAEALRARGVTVTDVAIYKTKILRHAPDAQFSNMLKSGAIDYFVFPSPSAVHGFVARVKANGMRSARNIPAIAIGPGIVATLKRAGFRTIIMDASL